MKGERKENATLCRLGESDQPAAFVDFRTDKEIGRPWERTGDCSLALAVTEQLAVKILCNQLKDIPDLLLLLRHRRLKADSQKS